MITKARVAAILLVFSGLAAGYLWHERNSTREVRLVLTGELRARVRRCGCQGPDGPTRKTEVVVPLCCKKFRTMEQLVAVPDAGGLPERSAWLARLRETGDVFQVDTGDLLQPALEPAAHERGEWTRRAELLAEAYALLRVDVFVPGELDLALGKKELVRILARAPGLAVLAGNVADAATKQPLFPARATLRKGGARVGFVGVVEPPSSPALDALLAREGLVLSDALDLVRREVAALRADGVALVVLLAHAPEERARALAREVSGIDLAFASHADVPSSSPSPIEGTTAIARAVPGGGVPVIATVRVTPGARGVVLANQALETRVGLERLAKDLALERAELAKAVDPKKRALVEKDIAFTEGKIRELEQKLPAGRHEAALAVNVLDARPNREGQDQELLRAIERFKTDVEAQTLDPALVAAMEALGRRPDGSDLGFLTATTCATCHGPQTQVWQESKHAKAWTSLELGGNQKDPECVRCHSIGFREPGGFAEVKRATRQDTSEVLDFRGVQCESCHGPRLGHPATPGLGTRFPTFETCTKCHDQDHDPTFDRTRYDEAIKGGRLCVRRG